MTARLGGGAPLQLWGGVECTVNRVGDRYFDQLTRSGHRHRLEDFDRFAALGLRKLRMPVLWESIARVPEGGEWRWVDTAMARMRALRMEPIVGLVHHGSGPADTSLVDPAFPEKAARHARAVAERYPDVVEWTPINEPLTTARFAALYGHWYPHARSPVDFVRALLGQVEATAACMRAIREVSPRARLVQTEDFGRVFGTAPLDEQVRHETERRFLGIDLLCGRVDRRHPLWPWLRACGANERALLRLVDAPCPPDIVGINYYVTSDRWLDHRCDRYPPWTHGGNGRQRYADLEAVRVLEPSPVSHLEVLLEVWQRYRLPVALTEVHIGCSADERARWLVEGWRAACEARDRGADVRAVTAWALLGVVRLGRARPEASGPLRARGLRRQRAPAPRHVCRRARRVPGARPHTVRRLAGPAGMVAATGTPPLSAGGPRRRQGSRAGQRSRGAPSLAWDQRVAAGMAATVHRVTGSAFAWLASEEPGRAEVPLDTRYPRSRALRERALRVLPGGGHLIGRPLGDPERTPTYMDRGRGARVTDVDGHEYIDWLMAFGPFLLGYAHPEVDEAGRRQLERGPLLSMNHPVHIEYIEALVARLPGAEMGAFFRTGSEATTAALRIARRATGRTVVVRAGYHGWHDWCLPREPFVPRGLDDQVLEFRADDPATLQACFEARPGEIAAVIVAPEMVIPTRAEVFHTVARITRQGGAVLVLDEVKTALRIAPGSVQQRIGLRPDLTTLSKALGNGWPIAAVLGSRAVMEHAAGLHLSATYHGDTAAMMASLKALEVIDRDRVAEHVGGARSEAHRWAERDRQPPRRAGAGLR